MIVLSAPPLLLGLVIGLTVSLFQALTSSEVTQGFVPKCAVFIYYLSPSVHDCTFLNLHIG